MSRDKSRRVMLRDAGSVMAAMILAVAARRVAAEGRRMDLRYQMRFGGVQVGTARFTATVDDERVSLRLVTEIEGLMGLMPDRSSDLRTELVDDGAVIRPVRFRGREERKDRVREALVRYDAEGVVTTVKLEQNGKARRSEVPEEQRRGTTDMLTALWRVRSDLAKGGDRPMAFAVFDGRKRFEVEATAHGAEAVEVLITPRDAGGGDDDEPLRIVAERLGDDLVPHRVVGRRRPPWEAVLDAG